MAISIFVIMKVNMVFCRENLKSITISMSFEYSQEVLVFQHHIACFLEHRWITLSDQNILDVLAIVPLETFLQRRRDSYQ